MTLIQDENQNIEEEIKEEDIIPYKKPQRLLRNLSLSESMNAYDNKKHSLLSLIDSEEMANTKVYTDSSGSLMSIVNIAPKPKIPKSKFFKETIHKNQEVK